MEKYLSRSGPEVSKPQGIYLGHTPSGGRDVSIVCCLVVFSTTAIPLNEPLTPTSFERLKS